MQFSTYIYTHPPSIHPLDHRHMTALTLGPPVDWFRNGLEGQTMDLGSPSKSIKTRDIFPEVLNHALRFHLFLA